MTDLERLLGSATQDRQGIMTKLEMVEDALRTLGSVSAQELPAHIQRQHGVRIEPKFIPVFRASIQDRLRMEAIKEAARAAAAQGAAAGSDQPS